MSIKAYWHKDQRKVVFGLERREEKRKKMKKENKMIKSGDRVKWQCTHHLNSCSTIEIVKEGKYYGRIRHTSKHWEKNNAKQMACVHFESNKNCSIVPFDELKQNEN